MPSNTTTEQNIGLNKNDLAELLAAAIAAAKAPNELEQQKLNQQKEEIRIAQESRKAQSLSVIQDLENTKINQSICSHEHADGHSHAVYIHEKVGPGYFLCQKLQCKIRPGKAPEGYKGGDIYNTEMFNKLFQKNNSNEIFG